MSRARIFYTTLLWLALPFILLRLFFRGYRQRDYWQHIGERFGFFSQAPAADVIWIHAVSVGETRAAAPLITALRACYPDCKILLTSMTPTGRAAGVELFSDALIHAYLPYDYPFAISRLIAHFQPRMLLILETEIWFNLIARCRQNNIHALLLNARMSEKSARAYAGHWLPRTLVAEALKALQHIAAQTEGDATRLKTLGAGAVTVNGNIKFDVSPEAAQLAKGQQWRGLCGNRQVLLCASTRDGEEALLLSAYKQAFDVVARKNTLLVIVPRHPERFDTVFALCMQHGLRVSRRTDVAAFNADIEVWLGDSMGEMFAYLYMCDVAIIGGSFMPLGGQNLIEASALAKPAIIGPSDFNFAEATRLAADAGALIQVKNAEAAMDAAYQLINDAVRRKQMSDAAMSFAAAHRGATEKIMAEIKKLLGRL